MSIIGKAFLYTPNFGYLTFSSPSAFSLSIIGSPLWDGVIEYSTNRCSWNVWTGLTAIDAGAYNGHYVLYVRGKNNTYITGANAATDNGAWHFSGSNISLIGELHYLLDYKKRTVPAVRAFASLFGWKNPGDYAIVTARELVLPMVLSEYCCSGMFSRCKGLVYPPKMPATNLVANCYRSTFYLCEGLNALPALYALTFRDGCYYTMFSDCTSIKLSTTKTGDYQTAYRIPFTGTGTTATDSLTYMFNGTGGTFAGTPTINTTYYTSNEVIS